MRALLTMHAVVQDRYGPPEVLELREIDAPTPADDEALVRVRAASIGFGDPSMMRGKPLVFRLGYGLTQPKTRVRGLDLAGEIEAVGRGIGGLAVGDAVFGSGSGACAEYAVAKAERLARKPANISFEQAAAVPTSGLAALQALRDVGRVQPGHKVLVNGASGGVGTFAVQIAKAFGAEVTGVCSTANVDLVRSIGADRVIDYTQEDFTRSGEQWNLILDNVQNLSRVRRAVAPDGLLIPNNGQSVLRVLADYLRAPFVRPRMRRFLSMPKQEDLVALAGLIEAGQVTPVIDRAYPLRDTAEAIRYYERGHAAGKVVITM